jgi:outer membrane protein
VSADLCFARLTRTILRVGLLGWVASVSVSLAAQAPAPTFPMTLQQAVQQAVGNYPAVLASAARVAAQEANVGLAHTAYLPRIDTSLQINRATRNNVAGSMLPGTTVPPISGPVSDVSSSGIWGSAGALLLSWEAFDFGQRSASVDVARTLVDRATATAQLTRLDVATRTADAFLRLAAAQEMVRAARANVERQQIFANVVVALVKNQLRPGADESRAQAELAAARIQLIQAEQADRVARAGLAQWVGADPADVRISTDSLLATPPASTSDTATAVAKHPLAETQMAAVESSQALQHALSRSYFPRVSVQTAYSLRDAGATAGGVNLGGTHGLGFDTPNWAVGFTATFPLFDYFSLRERTRIEAQNERAERASYDRVVRELSAQSAQAEAELEGARQIALNTPVQLQAARVLEQQSRARYDAGLATIIEVADAQRLLLQAEVGDAVARLGVWRALLADAAARGDVSALLK